MPHQETDEFGCTFIWVQVKYVIWYQEVDKNKKNEILKLSSLQFVTHEKRNFKIAGTSNG